MKLYGTSFENLPEDIQRISVSEAAATLASDSTSQAEKEVASDTLNEWQKIQDSKS